MAVTSGGGLQPLKPSDFILLDYVTDQSGIFVAALRKEVRATLRGDVCEFQNCLHGVRRFMAVKDWHEVQTATMATLDITLA